MQKFCHSLSPIDFIPKPWYGKSPNFYRVAWKSVLIYGIFHHYILGNYGFLMEDFFFILMDYMIVKMKNKNLPLECCQSLHELYSYSCIKIAKNIFNLYRNVTESSSRSCIISSGCFPLYMNFFEQNYANLFLFWYFAFFSICLFFIDFFLSYLCSPPLTPTPKSSISDPLIPGVTSFLPDVIRSSSFSGVWKLFYLFVCFFLLF